MAGFDFGSAGALAGSFFGPAGSAIGGAAGSLLGGLVGGGGNSWGADPYALGQQSLAFQTAAAQHGIRWRVADAQAAGISPLVALGAPTFNPSGIAVGVPPSQEMNYGRAGQDISGAIAKTMTGPEKEMVALRQAELLERTRLTDAQVNMMQAQANYYNARAVSTPNFPSIGDQGQVIAGQGNSGGGYVNSPVGGYTNKLPEPLTTGLNPGSVGGRAAPADQPYITRDGMLEFQPSAGSPAAQGDVFNSAINFLRNRLGPQRNDSPEIMAQIRKAFPGAVSYEPRGFGMYRPVYPEEEVRQDIRRAGSRGLR